MDRLKDQAPPSEPLDVEEWLAGLGAQLAPGIAEEIGSAERGVLLDLARIAAHRSQRMAAPLSTYLVGLSFATLPRAERLARIRELVARLERSTP